MKRIIILLMVLLLVGCDWYGGEGVNYEPPEKTQFELRYELMMKCEAIAIKEWNFTDPLCDLSNLPNKCICEEMVKNPCEEWEEKEQSKLCIKYKYTWQETSDMERYERFYLTNTQ